jgi:hypothetical protein
MTSTKRSCQSHGFRSEKLQIYWGHNARAIASQRMTGKLFMNGNWFWFKLKLIAYLCVGATAYDSFCAYMERLWNDIETVSIFLSSSCFASFNIYGGKSRSLIKKRTVRSLCANLKIIRCFSFVWFSVWIAVIATHPDSGFEHFN